MRPAPRVLVLALGVVALVGAAALAVVLRAGARPEPQRAAQQTQPNAARMVAASPSPASAASASTRAAQPALPATASRAVRRRRLATWSPSARSLRGRHDPHRVLVRFRAGTSSAARAAVVRQLGGRVERVLGPEGVTVVGLRRGTSVDVALRGLRGRRGVASVEPNRVYAISATPDDPFFPGNGAPSDQDLWGLQNTGQDGGRADADIDGPEAYDRLGEPSATTWPTADYAVGVVDTGAYAGHEDLAGKIVQPCSSALHGDGSLTSGCDDDNGHGSHVAGTIAATGNNGRGIVGVAPNAKVLPCKALDANGEGYDADIAACINQIVAARSTYHVKVLSMSLGGPDASSTLADAVQYASSSGILVLAAAGNEGSSTVDYPAGYPSVVSVGATDRNDAHASFSNANSKVEVSAPGVDIVSTVPATSATGQETSGYAIASGTSMATPHAAAVAALIGATTSLSGQGLRDRLDASVDDLGSAGRDSQFGFGRVNACLALGGSCTYAGASPAPTTTSPTTTSPTTTTPTTTIPTAPAPAPSTGTPRSAPPASPTPVTRSFRPTGYTVLTGTTRVGQRSRRLLYDNDGQKLAVSGVRRGRSYLADLYAFAAVPASLRASLTKLAVKYDGNASRGGSSVRLQAYDWTARRWVTVDGPRRVVTTDRTVTWTTTASPARYVSSSGQLRFRITASASGATAARTDQVSFRLTTTG